ncbi:alpha/beta fold hydrolase [Ruegeria arenilitoris]|uniref:alpha/beta fold hydrolase n=1 Tax=Ruegeria arenilitoris TaxID=1173585 RepID=UPI00147F02D9|nr:alpha/beta fold hydrolase [Ruegeria arenilitoris]
MRILRNLIHALLSAYFLAPSVATASEWPVACIQKHLNDLGFSAGAEDGILGRGTRQALVSFRKTAAFEGEFELSGKHDALRVCFDFKSIGVNRVTIPINGENEFKLDALLFRSDWSTKSSSSVILLHGWGGSASDVMFSGRLLAASGYNALAVSMRGWGRSSGTDDCGELQARDLSSVIDWVKKELHLEEKDLFLMGYSQGGQVSLLSAVNHEDLAGVVAFSSPTDMKSWASQTTFSGVSEYVGTVCSVNFQSRSPLKFAHKIRAPVLLFHGTRDSRVPTIQSISMKSAMESAGGNVELKLLPGARHHFNADQWAVAWEKLLVFLEANSAVENLPTIESYPAVRTNADAHRYWVSPNSPLLGFVSTQNKKSRNSKLFYMLPACLHCGERFLNRIHSLDKADNVTFVFGGRSDDEIDTLVTLFCSDPKDLPFVLVGYYNTLISTQKLLKTFNLEERSKIAKLVAEQIVMSFGTNKQELEICSANKDFEFASVASVFLHEASLQSTDGHTSTPNYFQLIEPFFSGGAGNGIQPEMARIRYFSRPEYSRDEYLAEKEAVLEKNRDYLRLQNRVVLGAAVDEGLSKIMGPMGSAYTLFKVAGFAVQGENEMAQEAAKSFAAGVVAARFGEIPEVIVGGTFDVLGAKSFGEEYAAKKIAEQMVYQAAIELEDAKKNAPSVVVVPAQ